jgi:hypothetical protein
MTFIRMYSFLAPFGSDCVGFFFGCGLSALDTLVALKRELHVPHVHLHLAYFDFPFSLVSFLRTGKAHRLTEFTTGSKRTPKTMVRK